MRFPIHLGMVLFLTLRISKAGVLPPSPDEVEIDFFDDPASTISSVDGGDDHITDDMLMAAVPAAEPQVDAQKSAIDDETSSGSTHWYAIDHCDKNSVRINLSSSNLSVECFGFQRIR